jgi:hypothetical protein
MSPKTPPLPARVENLVQSAKDKLDSLPRCPDDTSGAVVSQICADLDEIVRIVEENPSPKRRFHPWMLVAVERLAEKVIERMSDACHWIRPHWLCGAGI